MRYLSVTGMSNRKTRSDAAYYVRREASAKKRKSPAAKRMDRPHRLDAAVSGHFKIESFLSRSLRKA